MNIFEYIESEHADFKEEINYFLNNKNSIISGGFVRSLLLGKQWSKELDVISYNFKEMKKDFLEKFPTKKIKETAGHAVLYYENGYIVDLIKPFQFNDFSFNCGGLYGENLIVVDNILNLKIEDILYFIDKNQIIALGLADFSREIKFKDIISEAKNKNIKLYDKQK
jgi:hypothetical protein